ncbi:undecaprenyl-phosphate glucose phosphotransferase [Acidihalobacter aeolianus]|uniref:Undecaprenyl-phosphate glucose phosphotransferase n=1 Tax=Acidihalobacter aeolianus TaxID=2792603 RepID=A0A1D8K9E9_9GAMM|nr:undecaprenyl-phosphate glucose phosphotransferase [Acidihalobacter aeolianus]AOV17565.1 undecaprenyl-phosphate glucose phosphotransferase [Acidihalobacter aeolianus]
MLRRGLLRDYSSALAMLTRVLDVILVCFAGWLAFKLRFHGINRPPMMQAYLALTIIGSLVVSVVFPPLSIYKSWRAKSVYAPAGRALLGWCIVFAMVIIALVVVHEADIYSRLWLGFWFVLSALFLVGLRFVVYWVLRELRSRGYNRRPVVVVGAGLQGENLAERVHEADWSGLEVLGLFDTPEYLHAYNGDIPRYSIENLPEFVTCHQVTEVWVAMPLERSGDLRQIIALLRNMSINVRYAPDLFGLSLLNHGLTEIVGVPMIDLSASPMQGINRLMKALEDRLLASLILVLMSPVIAFIACGVKLSSPGPVLFRQRRHGWDGQEIVIYKFRTMYVEAEAEGPVQAKRDDPRVTPFGRWLRKTSLDELPQFINVLQGRMSIVGPRPHAVEHNAQFCDMIDRYMLRHMVKPGITGWAQINGWRGETDTIEKMQHRVGHDLYYIEHWSLGLDLKIIFLTLFKGFVHRNAF